MGRLIEGLWDCKQCGRNKIPGGVRECPGCGKPRDKNTKFYMPFKLKYVPKEEEKKINRNPDWVCIHCGEQLNSDNDKFCKSCGAPKNEENPDYFGRYTNKKEQDVQGIDKKEEVFEEPTENVKNKKITKKSNVTFSWNKLLLIIGSALLIIGLVFLIVPKEKELTVNSVSWKRTIDIERIQAVNESGWSIPSGGRLLYSRSEIHHYDSVLDHYETRTRQVSNMVYSGETYKSSFIDLGNGYFEERIESVPVYETVWETEEYEEPVYVSVPVYDTKYYYEIDKWLYERSIVTSGNDKFPYWGKIQLNDDERKADMKESYSFSGSDEGNQNMNISVSYSDWQTINIGETLKVKINLLGYGSLVK